MKCFLFSMTLLGLAACISTQPSEPAVTAKMPPMISLKSFSWRPALEKRKSLLQPIDSSDFKPVPLKGDNIHPALSPDGKRLAYASFKRSLHEFSEIYVTDLISGVEKRITFQRGDALFPVFHPHRKNLVYSSSSEELSEHADVYIQKLKEKIKESEIHPTPPKNLPPFQLHPLKLDVFLHDLSGSERTRLTRTRGYDGDADFSNGGRRIIFSSIKNGDRELFSMNLNGRSLRQITKRKGYDGLLRMSPGEKSMVWVHAPKDFSYTELRIAKPDGKKAHNLPLPKGIHWSPRWHASGKWIIFSSNMDGGKNFSLYAIRPEGHCLTRLTSEDVHALFAAPHPLDARIFYTRYNHRRWTIGSREFSLPRTCLIESP